MQPQQQPNIRLQLTVVILGVIGVTLVLFFSFHHPKTTPTGSTPNQPTTPQTQTTYDGFDDLTTIGLTSVQLDDIKFALFQYTGQQKISQPIAFAASDTDHHRDAASGNDIYTFTVHINNQSYGASASTQDFTSIDLVLLDDQGNQVFDSGSVDLSSNADSDSN